MNKREKRPAPSFSNFGFSTILLAFVMICIVTISALSLLTANSDYKLSQKVAKKNSDYYLAEATAYETLAEIDTLLANAYTSSHSKDDYFANAEQAFQEYDMGIYYDNVYTYTVQITENQILYIDLLVKYPAHEQDSFYQILSWQSIYEIATPEDEFLDLID